MGRYAEFSGESPRNPVNCKIMVTSKDEELIALLRLNAREPVASLARKLDVSRSTVQDRLARLEKSGVIKGYGVRLAEETREGGIRAWMTLEVEPRKAQDVVRALTRLAAVETLHTVSGKFDYVALVRTATADDMDRFLDHVGQVPGVMRTESAVILSTKLDRR
jgi:DNA-binding Lrp family transcriptional regulator